MDNEERKVRADDRGTLLHERMVGLRAGETPQAERTRKACPADKGGYVGRVVYSGRKKTPRPARDLEARRFVGQVSTVTGKNEGEAGAGRQGKEKHPQDVLGGRMCTEPGHASRDNKRARK